MVEKPDAAGQNERSPDMRTASHGLQTGKPKTCVIILGRGNSFSLSRSEVLLLNPRRGRSNPRPGGVHGSTPGCLCGDPSNKCGSISLLLNGNTPEHGSLNAVCNGRATESHSSCVCSSVDVGDEVNAIWRKAEMIMAAKHDTVLQILEKFGIGRAWGVAEGGADRMAEEELIWKRVEVNAGRRAANTTVTETGKGRVQPAAVVTDMLE